MPDIIGLSFVRRPADVTASESELARLNGSKMGIMLKIETRSAFEHLPALLLQAMRGGKVGVMIARGDLAVESDGNAWRRCRKNSLGVRSGTCPGDLGNASGGEHGQDRRAVARQDHRRSSFLYATHVKSGATAGNRPPASKRPGVSAR